MSILLPILLSGCFARGQYVTKGLQIEEGHAVLDRLVGDEDAGIF